MGGALVGEVVSGDVDVVHVILPHQPLRQNLQIVIAKPIPRNVQISLFALWFQKPQFFRQESHIFRFFKDLGVRRVDFLLFFDFVTFELLFDPPQFSVVFVKNSDCVVPDEVLWDS